MFVPNLDRKLVSKVNAGKLRITQVLDDSNIPTLPTGKPGEPTTPMLTEIAYMKQAFRELVGELLREIADFSEIEAFEREVSERAAFV